MSWNNKLRLCAIEHTLDGRDMNELEKARDIDGCVEYLNETDKSFFFNCLYEVFSLSGIRLRAEIKKLR